MKSPKVSYTQDLLPDDLNHNLGTPKYELWKGEILGSLSKGGRQPLYQKVLETLTPTRLK